MEIFICKNCKININGNSDIYKAYDCDFCCKKCRHEYFINLSSSISSQYIDINEEIYNINNKLRSHKSINNLNLIDKVEKYNKTRKYYIEDYKTFSICQYYFNFSINNFYYIYNYLVS